ncbi:MAG: NUDIX domain-containing protein [Bacteroidota bacterium]
MPKTVSQIVEVCVFRIAGGEHRFLLLKRSADEKIYPGIWQIVTGKIEETEHTVTAALREVREETGFSPHRFWRLPFVNSFYEPVRDLIHLCPYFAAEVSEGVDPVLSPEHQEYQWCTFERAQALLPWSGQRTGVSIVHNHIIPGTEESRLLEIPPVYLERKEH